MSKMSTRWDYFKSLGIAIGCASGVAMSLTLAVGANCAFCTKCSSEAIAQITPDTTLPNNSTLKLEGNTRIIEGGTRAGGNLFHSFREFSVRTGETAHFNNAADIQNIFSRVTAKSVSNIDGLIKANGTANLFLINPSGIIFSRNASLNIGGSFLASTASSLKFADGTDFSATAPQTTPQLTVSAPIGLQFGTNPGSIQNLSQATNGSGETAGLQVQPDKTLGLVGGNVSFDGGSLTAQGGRVEIAGVAEPGTIGLNVDGNDPRVSFPDHVPLADVSLSNGAILNLSSAESVLGQGGNIDLKAHILLLRRNSQIYATDGNISIDTNALVFTDESSNKITANSVEGRGGTINIRADLIIFPHTNVVSFKLPQQIVDATRLINQNFCAATSGTGSRFTITGRGGLPPSPNSMLNSDAVWEDWRLTAVPHNYPASTAKDFQPTTTTPKRTTPEPIVEATGWVKNAKGEVFLTASSYTVTPHSSWYTPTNCDAAKSPN